MKMIAGAALRATRNERRMRAAPKGLGCYLRRRPCDRAKSWARASLFNVAARSCRCRADVQQDALGHLRARLLDAGRAELDDPRMTLSSDFTAKVPDLTIEQADVTANTHATFVTVAGQNLNELDAKTTYRQEQVDFDATAKQPQRTLGASGTLTASDHREFAPGQKQACRPRIGTSSNWRWDRRASVLRACSRITRSDERRLSSMR